MESTLLTAEDVFEMGRDQAEGCPEHNWHDAVDEYLGKYADSDDFDTRSKFWERHQAGIEDAIAGAAWEAEENSRQFSPWEFECKELNDLQEHVEFDVWEAYQDGINDYVNAWIEQHIDEDVYKWVIESLEELQEMT